MKKLAIVLFFAFLALPAFAYYAQAPASGKIGETVNVRFLNDGGTPARGLYAEVYFEGGKYAVKTDNAGYASYVPQVPGTYSYGFADRGVEFGQKTLVGGSGSGEEPGSLIQNAARTAEDMGGVLVSSATVIIPLFVAFLLLSFIIIYFVLKER